LRAIEQAFRAPLEAGEVEPAHIEAIGLGSPENTNGPARLILVSSNLVKLAEGATPSLGPPIVEPPFLMASLNLGPEPFSAILAEKTIRFRIYSCPQNGTMAHGKRCSKKKHFA
jgi:hypothetical protein